MADNTRDDPKRPASSSNQSKTPITIAPPENANLMPGGTMNTAGGKMREAGYIDGIKSIKWSDFMEVHKKPCVREAFLTGIGAGFAVGGVRSILGGPTVLRSCNWAVGTFCFGSFLMHEYCQRKRHLSKQGMKHAMDVIDQKRTERKLQAEAARINAQKAKEESGASTKKS